ncbi:unnamed protein product [Blepharisma stoltei]|uniref:3'-5' exonuclease domain-containing protein n=1 Tax=Blepharisma stoltei TaxID=1481888 RepID=A0AAU9J4H0_9CILI|nr:unnamed protein product [Blepharisma stoltei]
MGWLEDSLVKLKNNRPIFWDWARFIDSIDPIEPHQYYRILQEYLSTRTYLIGDEIFPEDLYLVNKLKQIPTFTKVLCGTKKPEHLCRWFNQVFSTFPDEKHEYYLKHSNVIDNRLIKAIREGDYSKFEMLLDLIDVNAKESESGPRPIHIACETGNFEILVKLLQKGASIETKDDEGLTPIFYAIQNDHKEIVEYLIANGANINHIEDQKRSLLYWTASLGKIEYIDKLLEKNCDPNIQTRLGRTCLSKAAWNGNLDVLKRLLKVPSIDVDIPDSKGRTALHNAIWGPAGGRSGKKMAETEGDSPECAKLLIEAGANIEVEDNAGNTPICIACSTYALDSLKLLIECGADKFHESKDGYSPLHQALARGNIECAEILIQNGVDPNQKSKGGRSGLEVSIQFGQDECVAFLLEFKIDCSQKEVEYCMKYGSQISLGMLIDYYGKWQGMVEYCLLEGNDNCAMWMLENIESLSLEELKTAFKRNEKIIKMALEKWKGTLPKEILELGLEYEFDVSKILAKVKPSLKALHTAIIKGKEEIAIDMIKHYPKLLQKLNPLTGRTALHLAAEHGFCNLAAALISSAPNPCEYINLLDTQGLSAMIIAEIHKFHYFTELLKDLYSQVSNREIITHIKSIEYEETDEEIPIHPYANIEMPTEYFDINIELKDIPSTELIWVDTVEKLERMKEYLQEIKVIGIDLEYFTFAYRKGCISLVQISSGAKDFVVDPLINRKNVGEYLKVLMRDPGKVKVLHGADSDLMWLQNDFLAYAINVFDTARAYRIIKGDADPPSLAILLYVYLNVKADKTFQVADWRIRPLPQPMMEYARTDAHYLPELYQKLIAQMSSKNFEELAKMCNSLCLRNPTSKYYKLNILNCG